MNTGTNQIKYFGYCRKSSEDDGRQVLSLPAQKKELQTIAESNHLKVLHVYVEAKSAKSEGREMFNQMIARIKKGEARGIICWKLDRLARNMIDGGQIMDLLQRGVIEEIRTYEKPYLPTDYS
jgi:site-specific DNA recombinase